MVVLISCAQKEMLAVSGCFGPWMWEQECCQCGEGDHVDGTVSALQSVQSSVEPVLDANGGVSNHNSLIYTENINDTITSVEGA